MSRFTLHACVCVSVCVCHLLHKTNTTAAVCCCDHWRHRETCVCLVTCSWVSLSGMSVFIDVVLFYSELVFHHVLLWNITITWSPVWRQCWLHSSHLTDYLKKIKTHSKTVYIIAKSSSVVLLVIFSTSEDDIRKHRILINVNSARQQWNENETVTLIDSNWWAHSYWFLLSFSRKYNIISVLFTFSDICIILIIYPVIFIKTFFVVL